MTLAPEKFKKVNNFNLDNDDKIDDEEVEDEKDDEEEDDNHQGSDSVLGYVAVMVVLAVVRQDQASVLLVG